MTVRSVKIPNARLTEGESYLFRIVKSMSLTPGDSWYVLEDPNGYKILLPGQYYEKYGFRTGQTIRCRVDKINCNGRMFLEPAHPHYVEGESYQFPVISKGHYKNIIEQDEYYFTVRDVLGHYWKVRTYEKPLWDNPPEQLACIVKRIKKGKLFLVIAGEEMRHPSLETGKSYHFTIVDEKINPLDHFSYFIVEDKQGNKHLLKKKYYLHYGLKKGRQVRCRVDKFASEGFFFLEPEHPCYQMGKTYRFPVVRLEEMVFMDGYRQKVLVVHDCFGEEVKIHQEHDEADRLKDYQTIQARVDRIRKSRLELALADENTT